MDDTFAAAVAAKARQTAAGETAAISIDIDSLVDIRTIVIDQSLPVSEKKLSYLRQIRTPEICRCGDTIVRISHVDTDVTLADRIKQYLLSKQSLSLL